MMRLETGVRGLARCSCMLLSLLLPPVTLPAGPAAAEPAGWSLAAMTDAGRIYHRGMDGSPIPMLMIVTTFHSTPAQVTAVVTDYDHFAEFIPYVLESRVLQREGHHQWVFHRLRFPGPVSDRAYVFRSTGSQPGERHFRVEWRLSERQFSGVDQAPGIRPKRFSGFWDLRPDAGGGATLARYAVHSDPGGLVPAWLTTRVTDRYVQQVIEAVRRRLQNRSPVGPGRLGDVGSAGPSYP
jgi:hypothetical protein